MTHQTVFHSAAFLPLRTAYEDLLAAVLAGSHHKPLTLAAASLSFAAAPFPCPSPSGRTRVSADTKCVPPSRQQNPGNPTTRHMTAHKPAHTAVKFQLLVDSVAGYCQSTWQREEWLVLEKPEGQALPSGCRENIRRLEQAAHHLVIKYYILAANENFRRLLSGRKTYEKKIVKVIVSEN